MAALGVLVWAHGRLFSWSVKILIEEGRALAPELLVLLLVSLLHLVCLGLEAWVRAAVTMRPCC